MSLLQKLRRVLFVGMSCLLILLATLVHAADRKTLTVAIEPVYPPFEFRTDQGDLQGFDVDVIRAVGDAAGFEVKFQSLPFDGIIPALQAQTVDAAVAAMTITQERSQAVSFSRPYFKAGLAIAVQNQTNDIQSLDDLKGRTIAVQIGTTGAIKAQTIAGATLRTFDSAVLALQELRNGNVEAVIHDTPIILYAIKTGGLSEIKTVNEFVTEEYYGIPTSLNSPNLRLINGGLTTILDNGTYAKLYRKWFNADPPTLPETAPGITTGSTQTSMWSGVVKALPLLLRGAVVTLQLTTFSVVFGLVGGSLLGIARLSKILPVRWVARAYIDFFRGTPLLVQIFMIYFGLPAIVQQLGGEFSFDRFVAAVVALTLNSAAYLGEIVRAGIQSIEPGQAEAAQSLGLNSVQTLRYVIFPQAFRRMLPPLGNQFISLLKDTSLVAVIGFEELFRQGQLVVAQTYRPFEIYAAVAFMYLALTLLSSQVFSALERWMDPVGRDRKSVAEYTPPITMNTPS